MRQVGRTQKEPPLACSGWFPCEDSVVSEADRELPRIKQKSHLLCSSPAALQTGSLCPKSSYRIIQGHFVKLKLQKDPQLMPVESHKVSLLLAKCLRKLNKCSAEVLKWYLYLSPLPNLINMVPASNGIGHNFLLNCFCWWYFAMPFCPVFLALLAAQWCGQMWGGQQW